jgi:hypothetical protein
VAAVADPVRIFAAALGAGEAPRQFRGHLNHVRRLVQRYGLVGVGFLRAPTSAAYADGARAG